MKSTNAAFTRTALRMLSGVLIWALHFGVIYSFTALACARGFADASWLGIGVVPWVIAVATLAAATAVSVMIVRSLRWDRRTGPVEESSGFLHWMTAAIGGLALIAIVWEALPVLMVPICG